VEGSQFFSSTFSSQFFSDLFGGEKKEERESEEIE